MIKMNLKIMFPIIFLIFLARFSPLAADCLCDNKTARIGLINKTSEKKSCLSLKGMIDDCDCSVEIIDEYNNLKIHPRLSSILANDYFRYWKVNLNKKCEFWEDDSQCTIRYCHVKPCDSGVRNLLSCCVPEDIKIVDQSKKKFNKNGENFSEKQDRRTHEKEKYFNSEECSQEDKLGSLNTSLSDESKEHFLKWAAHDDLQETSFCYIDDESSEESEYVDLLLNPERFTGYAGDSSHRVWSAIYEENCFKPTQVLGSSYTAYGSHIESRMQFDSCLEKRTFYRAISGLHSSINIHLCSKYLLSDREGFMESNEGVWGPNVEEFVHRFDKVGSEVGARRLKNLYFLYLLELKALSKAAPYLKKISFFTGNEKQDTEMKQAVGGLLSIIEAFPKHFNEDLMFVDASNSAELKTEFRDHFRNISKIMDCVGCDKCRLWGKLQVTGLGTALKILFSEKSDSLFAEKSNFYLTRVEIVALFNAFGRLSDSISNLDNFRKLIKSSK